MTKEEIIAFQRTEKELSATPVGAAFFKFKNALSRAWQLDTEDSLTDRDRKSTKEAHAAAVEAEKNLKAEIRKLLADATRP